MTKAIESALVFLGGGCEELGLKNNDVQHLDVLWPPVTYKNILFLKFSGHLFWNRDASTT